MEDPKHTTKPPAPVVKHPAALRRGRENIPKKRRLVSVREFFDSLYQDTVSPDAQLVIWSASRKGARNQTDWHPDIDSAYKKAKGYRASKHVYFGVCLQNPHQALSIGRKRRPNADLRNTRGSEDSAVVMPALWVDIDCREGRHSQKHLPGRAEAMKLLKAVPVGPSALVWSGGGFHAYWIFREPLELTNADERRQAKELVARLQGAIAREAQSHKWTIDNTADLARVLRIPNTLNHKTSPPLKVTVEELNDARYNPSDFDTLPSFEELGDWPDVETVKAPRDRRRKIKEEGPPANYRAVMAGCSWLRHCEKDAASLPEPEWYAALSIVARTADGKATGPELGHQISRGYPAYDPVETDRKIHQALSSSSARTCGYIAGKLQAWESHCKKCAHWNQVKSPIALGRDKKPAAVGLRQRENILITTWEKDVADTALKAVVKADAGSERSLYQRFGALVHVVRQEPLDVKKQMELVRRPTGSPSIRDIHPAHLREIVSEHCSFARPVRSGSDELRPAHPPEWLISAVHARGEWREVPRLQAVIEGPICLGDGSILQKPGYNPDSGILYTPNTQFRPVPLQPTAKEIRQALALLDEVVCDFPFQSETHHSAWLASVLTPLCHFAFMGPSPLNLIDANIPGAGKSMLADTASMIVSGRPAPRMRYSPNDEEMRKAITSLALSGAQTVLIDNLSGRLASPTLDTALTATTWRDRVLGTNRSLDIPLDITWYATGNNVTIGADTYRRSLHIRLETQDEHPERRTSFRHPNLLEWIGQERRRIQPAALTLLRGYFAAGRPDQGLSGWGSYEEWSEIVRACIVWTGRPDPGITRDQLEAVDDSRVLLIRIMDGIETMVTDKGRALSGAEILELSESQRGLYPDVADALAEVPQAKHGKITARSLGYYLRDQRNRFIEGRSIQMQRTGRKGRCWFIGYSE